MYVHKVIMTCQIAVHYSVHSDLAVILLLECMHLRNNL